MIKILKYKNKENAMQLLEKTCIIMGKMVENDCFQYQKYEYHAHSKRPHWIIRMNYPGDK